MDNSTVLASRPPLALEVLPILERMVITRALAPGSRLVEEDLCARYGISRSPLREALRHLETSGLAIRRPRFGVRVAPMTVEDLDQVFACRVPLEALASAGVAASPDRIAIADQLAVFCDRMAAAYAATNIDACFAANVDLTDRLHRHCGNPVLERLLAQVDKPALRYRHWAYSEKPELLAIATDANRRLVAAIRAGAPAEAERVTRDLVGAAWGLVRSLFAARGAA
jgi:DNA-binding GntR family transcriptional regulator